jgi:hypothetical protein
VQLSVYDGMGWWVVTLGREVSPLDNMVLILCI